MASKSSASKKGATRKAAQPVQKAKTKWWLWLFVLCLAGAFIFGLAQLSKVQPVSTNAPVKAVPKPIEEKKAAPSTNTPAKKPTVEQQQTTQKKDNFEFYQLLQDSEVDTSHVDAYQSTPRGKQDFLYMIQAASFRSNTDADRMRAKLILSGLEARIRKTIGKDGRPWYRVVLGPFESRSKMSRAQDKLVSMDIQSYTYRIKKED